jgi:hypothetical protein
MIAPRKRKQSIGYWGVPMASNAVNLDALIKREDFLIEDNADQQSSAAIKDIPAASLEDDSMVYHALRKPDFQRQTSSWVPEKIVGFIRSFIDGDLIPCLILWRSPISKNIFVIDGAHRLSALIAWVRDDYGDKELSTLFFDNVIPPEQVKIARKTRLAVEKEVGKYELLKRAGRKPEAFPDAQVKLGRALGFATLEVQWLVGDAEKAEKSFKKINREATPISETEMSMIDARRKPNAIIARAIMHSGTGHKYWSAFPPQVQEKIVNDASFIYNLLFAPEHKEDVIRSLEDIPIAGKGYAPISLPLLWDFVNLTNELRQSTSLKELADDPTGEQTLEFLRKVKRLASTITGVESRSLGLHPFVYSYSERGRFQPSSFLALVGFLEDLRKRDQFFNFTKHRKRFEEFLLTHRHFVKQIVGKFGSALKSDFRIVKYYQLILKAMIDNKDDAQIVDLLRESENMPFLVDSDAGLDVTTNQDFSKETKSAIVIKASLPLTLRCDICEARLPAKAISFDHNQRKQDGGGGNADNGRPSHPYCNTGYKEKLEDIARKAASK